MKRYVVLLSVLMVVCVAGCHPGSSDSRINMARGVQSDTLTDNIITRPIGDFVSFMVGEGVEVTNVVDRVNPQGFLEVQVEVYNHAKMRKIFDYKVQWLDRDGMVQKTVMSKWVSKSVMPESLESFRVIAPNTMATDYRINTRVNKTMR